MQAMKTCVKIYLTHVLLAALLLTSSNLWSKNARTIQDFETPMILLTPQVYQHPESHKIHLPEQIHRSNIRFTLYHHTGVKVLEKQLDLTGQINAISLDLVLKDSRRLPSGYYFYEIGKPDYSKTSASRPDSLLFRDVSKTHLPTDSTCFGYSEFADLNGDSHPDIITGFFDFHQPGLLINDGNGHFDNETSTRLPQVEFHTSDLAVLDADSDGDLDLFFAAEDTQATNQIQSSDRLFLNDGSGVFTDVSATHLPQLNNISVNADWGFINNDLFPDLLLTGLSPTAGDRSPPFRTQLFVLINDGSGSFEDQSSNYLLENLSLYGAHDAALTDINGDSLVDIAMANIEQVITDETGPTPIAIFSGQNAVFVQNSNNQFVDETTARMPEDNDGGRSIIVSDINSDNAPELYVINFGVVADQNQALYLNDGSGVFQDVTTERLPQQNTTSLNDAEFKDFDGNGYMDMYIVNNGEGGPAADILNLNENGVFTDASSHLPAVTDLGLSVTSADIDKDGDYDIFVSTSGLSSGEGVPDKLLENLSIVVSVSQPPIAQPRDFELSQNYPNPFNPATTIIYGISESQAGKHVSLQIYNSRGQKVRTLIQGPRPAGTHQIQWDGKDDRGKEVSGGVYVYRFTVGTFTQAGKMLFLK